MTTGTAAFGATRQVVAAAGGAVLVLGVVLAVVAGVRDGAPAAAGVGVAAVVVAGFFVFGTLSLAAFIRAVPAMALAMAMLTYTFQVVVLGLVFAVLNGSGLLGESLDARWLGGAMIVLSLVWVGTHTVVAARARIPLYDLPDEAGEDPADGVAEGREVGAR